MKLLQWDQIAIVYLQTYTRLIILLSLILLQAACNSTYTRPADPLQSLNRNIYQFNRQMDKIILKPLAQSYQKIPVSVRQGGYNFLSNLNDASVISNDLLQGKLKQAGQDTGRLLLNSSVGFFGVVDVATPYGLPKHYESFGQTLAVWGVPSGPYLMLPFLGPSTLRDTLAISIDTQIDSGLLISNYYDKSGLYYGMRGVDILDTRERLLDKEEIMKAATTDEYSFIKEAYIQQQEVEILDGQVPSTVEDQDLFEDL